MNVIKWFFMSKYKKLLYHIECASENKQRLHLRNGTILDFTEDKAILKEYEELGTPNQIRAKLAFLNTYERADSDGRLVLILDKDGRCKELGGLHIDEIRATFDRRKIGWISVAERLPEKSTYDWVLVQVKMDPEGYYGVPHVAELRNGKWFGMGYLDDMPLEESCGIIVTHWMPLPVVPES